MSERLVPHRTTTVSHHDPQGRRLAGRPDRVARVRAGQGRGRPAQRADRHGRHRHRRPRLLRHRLLHARARCALRGLLRCAGRSARGRQAGASTPSYGKDCPAYRDFRELLARPRHRRRADHHRLELARLALDLCGQGGQGRVLRKALLEDDCGKPGPGRCLPPHGAASSRAACSGGTCRTSSSPPNWPGRGNWASCKPSMPIRADWAPAPAASARDSPSRRRTQVDWDMFLGSAPWRPYNPGLLNSGFEKGRRNGRRRVPGMGLPLHRHVPMGQPGRRHGPRRVLPVENGGPRPAMPTA